MRGIAPAVHCPRQLRRTLLLLLLLLLLPLLPAAATAAAGRQGCGDDGSQPKEGDDSRHDARRRGALAPSCGCKPSAAPPLGSGRGKRK